MKVIIERTDGELRARDVTRALSNVLEAECVVVIISKRKGTTSSMKYQNCPVGRMPKVLRELARISAANEKKL